MPSQTLKRELLLMFIPKRLIVTLFELFTYYMHCLRSHLLCHLLLLLLLLLQLFRPKIPLRFLSQQGFFLSTLPLFFVFLNFIPFFLFRIYSDWHIPRAMLIFQQTAKRFPNSPPFEFKHLPTPTLLSHLSLYSDNHLMDSLYLVHLITKEGPSEHLFDSLFENWREEMIVLRQTAIMKRGRSAAVAAPISKRSIFCLFSFLKV